ncbi:MULTISPECIES: DUF445 domain-containing protein [Sphingomonas]|nr:MULTISPECIES: DUF445 domain-containing protein [Sphingomonas]RSU66349.1 DUF445 domain-containing protein [Sphingomonas sp. S-NIH.Pt1_0416]MBQ1478885.1 DUF445 domain-containing protein [Sphingomonas sp.]MCM3678377.1 DUF445 domain-containing protein [Sphingomonas paucimobilis]NNG57017.1 DUF445 domain-containing protein [Sphingomonas paucimobilis]QBE94024.1 DUF445 domain-containing protein [Sphingomonas paucimobilis]
MRVVATGLLVTMAALFLIARYFQPIHPAWGFVRAFAEAAMVGGLADWFAVTALFRHPLGLPIPHTAIVPRNKDRIGETLANFLRTNFLVPRVVARRMIRLDVAGAAGRWLAQPPQEGGRIRRGASRLFAEMLTAFDPQRLGGMVKAGIGARLRATEVSPILGQLLKAAIAEGRHVPLMESVIRWAGQALAANEPVVRAMVHERAGAILRWTGLDETVADKLIDGLDKLLHDMAEDPGHPIRLKIEEGLDRLAWDLQYDPAMRARVEAMKDDLIANPAMQRWLDGLWEQAREGLLRLARDPEAVTAGKLGETLRQLGQTLQSDPRLASTINRFVRRAVVGIAADYGDGIVRLVSETVRGWDADTVTSRLENAVGRDLQYIRINGTLVGGSVGLVLHVVDRLL